MSRNTRERRERTAGLNVEDQSIPQWIPDTSTGWVPLASIVGWDRNPNRHPQAQIAQLAASFRRFGFVDAVTIARIEDEGVLELRAGHGRVEGLNAILREDPEFVPHGAPGPGLVRALIFDFPTRAAADAYGIANNRLAEIADPDEEVIAAILRELDADGFSLDGLGWEDGELEALLGQETLPTDDEWGSALGGLPSTDRAPIQAMTFTLHDEQAEQVKLALKTAIAAGPFVDTGNKNSNGNALARICEFYLTIGDR